MASLAIVLTLGITAISTSKLISASNEVVDDIITAVDKAFQSLGRDLNQ